MVDGSVSRWAYHVLDPFVGLALGVNEVGPALGELVDDPILHGQSVIGEASNLEGQMSDWVRALI